MRNLHRIMGSVYMHIKPNLCPFCEHFKTHQTWEGVCTVKQKLLSMPHAAKGRCEDFQKSEQPKLPQERIDLLVNDANEYKERRNQSR